MEIDINTKDIKDVMYKDIFSEVTRKIKAKLMLVSSLIILIKAYNLQLKSLSFLDFYSPDNISNLWQSILSIILLYLFVV